MVPSPTTILLPLCSGLWDTESFLLRSFPEFFVDPLNLFKRRRSTFGSWNLVASCGFFVSGRISSNARLYVCTMGWKSPHDPELRKVLLLLLPLPPHPVVTERKDSGQSSRAWPQRPQASSHIPLFIPVCTQQSSALIR